jgi:hypothetical protein
MSRSNLWPRVLRIVGLVGMVIGVVDPLEGSIVILVGIGLVTLESFLGRSRHRRMLACAFGLAAFGVAALFAVSSFGGIRMHRGDLGHSPWWGLFLVPYPIGWVIGLIGAVKRWREASKGPVRSAPGVV